MKQIIIKCRHNDNEIFEYFTNRLIDNGLSVSGVQNSLTFRNGANSIIGKVLFGISGSNSFFNFEIASPIGKFVGSVQHIRDELLLDIERKPLIVTRGRIITELNKISGSDGFFEIGE